MARRDPCAVYPLHAMIDADPMGAVMPSAAADLDALAKRLDVIIGLLESLVGEVRESSESSRPKCAECGGNIPGGHSEGCYSGRSR